MLRGVKWLCHLRSDGKLSAADVEGRPDLRACCEVSDRKLLSADVEGQPDLCACGEGSATESCRPLTASHVEGQPDLCACCARSSGYATCAATESYRPLMSKWLCHFLPCMSRASLMSAVVRCCPLLSKWLCHFLPHMSMASPIYARASCAAIGSCRPLTSRMSKWACLIYARAAWVSDGKLSSKWLCHFLPLIASHVVGLPDLCACCVGQRREVVVKVA